MLNVIPIEGVGEIHAGDDLSALICEKLKNYFPLNSSDCLVVSSKVISKSRGRIEKLTTENTKSEIVERESKRVLRRRQDVIVSETHHGFICYDAGVDESNCGQDEVVLLPKDIDSAAHGLRKAIQALCGFDISVIVSSKFDRPFRRGKTSVALGISGIKSSIDLEGEKDFLGKDLPPTKIAIVDEIAGAAELVMHKSSGNCAALIRGLPSEYRANGNCSELLFNSNDDLFR